MEGMHPDTHPANLVSFLLPAPEVRMDANETHLDAAEAAMPIECSYNAGDAGCGDGLHMDFRRQIQAIEVGQLLEFVVRDPSARRTCRRSPG